MHSVQNALIASLGLALPDTAERQMMKTCSRCKIKKEQSEFNVRRASKDGLCGQCRKCSQESLRAYQKTEKGREALQKYKQTITGKEARQRTNRRWRQTENGKESRRVSGQNYCQRYREKRRAHAAVSYALETGRLILPDHCEMCFIVCRPEGHHEDYSKQLEVDWLCTECHNSKGVKG